jgi:hypothetical protein
VPGKYGHSSYKNKKPSDGAQTQIRNFIVSVSHNFDYISIICGGNLPKRNCIGSVFKKVPVRAPGAQTRNVEFVKAGFIGLTDFIFVRYLASNSDMQCDNMFRFEGNAVKIKRI